MAARKKGRDVHGVFLLDKPAGFSSNQALQKVRRLLDARKAGHTGTLDPFATGMLPICLGEASKTAGFIMAGRKCYTATLLLGAATATGDTEGEVVETLPVPDLDLPTIQSAMAQFRGKLNQVPPMYSAIKQDGKPLYELARQGIVVERQARPVEIFQIELISWQSPLLEFSVVCSKGTYIRTLAEDVAQKLNCCGHLQALRRTGVEPFDEQPMYTLGELEQAVQQNERAPFLLSADAGLPAWPVVVLQADEISRFRHGNSVNLPAEKYLEAGRVRVHGQENEALSSILGLGEIRSELRGVGSLHPIRVFAAGVPIRPESSTDS
jgi:tRNA pseudouridine55 synthase